ncbi:MAG: hypothetical protein HN732_08125 [Rhodospirillaceae bacterium]|jgi:hypothetical protein|nr:hypothetical protein [Rhodospirillaceae bacterium]MBT7757277.1 hypothetical protein [Rhodospirillaceae bacterium]
MRLVSQTALCVVALAMLAACAGAPAWRKEGGTKAALEQDSTGCFRAASNEARAQMGNRSAASAPQIELRSSQGKIHDAAGASRKAASLQENALRSQLYSQCMQRLGYRRGGT